MMRKGDMVDETKVNRVDCVPISGQTLGYTEEVINGGGAANMGEPATIEVAVKDDKTIIYELDIKDVNTGEKRNSLDVITHNMVDGDEVAYAEEVNVGGGITNTKETTTQELPIGGNEAVIFGLEIKDVNTGVERKSSEVVSNNIIDGRGLAIAEEVNGVVGIAKEKETTPQEQPVKNNATVIYVLEITDVKSREERANSDVVKDGLIDGGLAASVDPTTDKIVIDSLENVKEADEVNVEVPVSILENEKRECRKDVNTVHNVKTTPGNLNRPKRKPLNRKMFEKQILLGNDEASMNETKALSSGRNDACNRTSKADSNDHVKNDEKAEAKPLVDFGRKLKRIRKKEVPEGRAGIIAANDEQKSNPGDNKPQKEENKKTDDDNQHLNEKDAEESGDGMSQFQRIKGRKVEKEHTIEVAAKRINSLNGVDCLGMIFMCSSETKEDCYRYGVFGLPAGKKNLVLKIYKGMRLFLFDFNLKVMYGIYKAAGPGGYNIEPRAFRSQFPSQVQFTIIEDCIPLAEDIFKSAIKDNYYTKNKFSCQLTSKQVKNLCKLFRETNRRANTKLLLRSQISRLPSSTHKDRKRRKVEDSSRAGLISYLEQERSQIPSEAGARHYPTVVSEMQEHYPIDHDCHAIYDREIYAQSTMPSPLYEPLPAQNTPPPLYQPLPAQITPPPFYEPLPTQITPRNPSFLYSGAPNRDMCRTDLALVHCKPSLCECGHYHELDRCDPYVSYVEAHAYHDPAYITGTVHAYQEPTYETVVTQECCDCYSDTCQVEYHRHTEYHPPFPPYRRY